MAFSRLLFAGYGLLWRLSGPFLGRVLDKRLRLGKEDLKRRGERLGIASLKRPSAKAGRDSSARVLVWVHSVSVGELVSCFPLVERLLENDRISVLQTTATTTSAQVFGRLRGAHSADRLLHQFIPLDHPKFVKRFIDHWRPNGAIWCEQELWPNLVKGFASYASSGAGSGASSGASSSRVPMFLVQGRMGDLSFSRWQRPLWRMLLTSMLGMFDRIYCQSLRDQERYLQFTDRSVQHVGNIKHVQPWLAAGSAKKRANKGAGAKGVGANDADFMPDAKASKKLFSYAAISIHEEDEDRLIAWHQALVRAQKSGGASSGVLSVVAHRHPVLADRFAARVGALGIDCRRFSRGEKAGADGGIFLYDVLGSMDNLLKRGPDIVVIGGSFSSDIGGHNPYEAVAAGKAVVFGSHMENFQEGAAELVNFGAALQVAESNAISKVLADLLASPSRLARQKATASKWRPKGDPVGRIVDDFLLALGLPSSSPAKKSSNTKARAKPAKSRAKSSRSVQLSGRVSGRVLGGHNDGS